MGPAPRAEDVRWHALAGLAARLTLALSLAVPLAAPLPARATHEQLPPELTAEQLVGFVRDNARPHEARPFGVPGHFDWVRAPRVGGGNNPGHFKAAIAWAHIFRTTDRADLKAVLQVRRMQAFICHGPDRRWMLVQRGPRLEGAQFRADFAQNANRRASQFEQADGVATIRFDAGAAFHYWTANGRFDLPSGSPLCGWLVLMQARQEGPPNEEPSYLVGVGADYWLDRQAPWDNFRTNHDAAIGRLSLARNGWTWFAMTTANEQEIRALREKGYTLRPGLSADAR